MVLGGVNEDFAMSLHTFAEKTKSGLPWLLLELIYSFVTCVHRTGSKIARHFNDRDVENPEMV